MPDHSPELKLVDDTSWARLDVDPKRIDPGIRLAASLIDAGDAEQLFRRTGMRIGEGGRIENPSLPLFVEIGPDHQRAEVLEQLAEVRMESRGFSFSFPRAYLVEVLRNKRLRLIAGRLKWSRGPVPMSTEGAAGLRGAIVWLLAQRGVVRLTLPSPLQPALEESLEDMEFTNRAPHGQALTGSGIIVGVVDDGCAVAHRHFLKPGTLQSRILFLWDQGGAIPAAGAGPWTPTGNFYGRELTDASINGVLANHAASGRVDEDAVYEALGYDIELSAHGTHVLDIAAGNGDTLMGHPGVAPDADIIFVQLPRPLVQQGGAVLEDSILHGVQYIFDRAARLNKQAVVNISFGGYCGPHDGSSRLASTMDALLDAADGRAVVVAAGNGYEADCHAKGTLNAGDFRDLVWLLRPEDPTSNQLEIWYEGSAHLELLLRPPGRQALQPPVGPGQWKEIRQTSDNQVIGWIQHENIAGSGAGSNVIRINLNSTVGENGSVPKGAGPGNQQGPIPTPPPLTAPVSSGAWTVRLRNPAGKPTANFHAWIERDERRRRGQQSRFQDGDADSASTLADLATGKLTICVGAHNAATSQMCRYSACGPTRDGRPKPDLTAPAEETAVGSGVLSASARRGRPARMAGTSAAAPHVAGLVALIMQAKGRLGAKEILKKLVLGANTAKAKVPPPVPLLKHNSRQEVDPHRNGRRQSGHFPAVIGAGKSNVPESTR